MHCIASNMKQKLSLAEKYRQYLKGMPEPSDKPHNKYNIFDDLNTTDKAMMKQAELYLHRNYKARKSRNKSEDI